MPDPVDNDEYYSLPGKYVTDDDVIGTTYTGDNIDAGGGWNPATGGEPSFDITKYLNGMFGATLTGKEWAKLAGITGGGIAGLMGANKPSVMKGSMGYQGKIPKYTAVQPMLTAPPKDRRPGSGGINYGTGVQYKDDKGNIVSDTSTSITDLLAAAKANPFNEADTLNYGVAPVPVPRKEDVQTFKPREPDVKAVTGGGSRITLPAGWSGFDPKQKIDWFNANNITPSMLIAEGVPQSDIDFMKKNGYNDATINQGIAAGVALPTGWNNLDAKAKIDYFNKNNIDENALTKAGTSAADFDFMKNSGYTGKNATVQLPTGLDTPDQRATFHPMPIEYPTGLKTIRDPRSMASFGDTPEDFGVVDPSLQGMAAGGLTDLARGGSTGRYLQGNTDGMADELRTSIDGQQPAALSHGEFVIPADVVSHLGNGNSDAGAKKLYSMMDKIREARTGTKKQGKQINPDKFMPGGLAAAYAGGGSVVNFITGGTVPAGTLGTEQTLASWTGDYVPNMLAKTEALTNTPYQAYTGTLTAGASGLQNAAFTGAGNLTTPSSIGTAATNANALGDAASKYSYTPTSFTNQFTAPDAYKNTIFTSGTFGNDQAQQYMNPYLQQSLNPQLAEARRQADITAQQNNAAMTKAGAFGGGRQAILTSENQRNLGTNMANITGQGYNTAFTNAMGQFNADQARNMQAQQASEQSKQFGATQGMTAAQNAAQYGQSAANATEASNQFANSQGLAGLTLANTAYTNAGNLGALQNTTDINNINAQAKQGEIERGIRAEGIKADRDQFEEARKDPYTKLLFQQGMLNGLPIAAQNYQTTGTSGLTDVAGGMVTADQMLEALGLSTKKTTGASTTGK
jgi:hypothetical protein